MPTRRDVLKAGLLAPAAIAAAKKSAGSITRAAKPSKPPTPAATLPLHLPRRVAAANGCCLILAGVFTLGTLTIPAKISALAVRPGAISRRREASCLPVQLPFDDSDWRSVDLAA